MQDSARNGEEGAVRALPTLAGPLAHHPPRLAVGALVVRSLTGGVTVGPREGREVLAGRETEEVHVGIGEDDRAVSRRHIAVRHTDGGWWLHNLGRRAVRLPTGRLLPGAEPVPLPGGYTAAFIEGTRRRTHLLELLLVDGVSAAPVRSDAETVQPRVWPLSPDEQMAMLVLGQRYLRHEPDPQPLSWHEAVEELAELDPDTGWTRKRVERKVGRLRDRLATRGVAGLRAEEVVGPLGNQLNHNLIVELVDSTTLLASDLAELEARLGD